MPFQLRSPYQPAGDQPEAINQLTEGILEGEKYIDPSRSNRLRKNIYNGKCDPECTKAYPCADT